MTTILELKEVTAMHLNVDFDRNTFYSICAHLLPDSMHTLHIKKHLIGAPFSSLA
jgi:hypothetical protein